MKLKWRQAIKRTREQLFQNQFVCLVSHFFLRFFAGEMLSSESDLRQGVGSILALLAVPGAVLPIMLLPKYSSFLRWMMGQRNVDYFAVSIPDKYMLLTLTMGITGIVAVVKWDALLPDKLDYANLAPLPLGTRRIFFAKLIALTLFVGLFTCALNAASTILFPYVVMGNERSGALWPRFALAHAVSTLAGSFFMFFFFFALMGLLMTLLPYRLFRQISTGVQFLLVVCLVMLLLFTPEIGSLVAGDSHSIQKSLDWLPTVWFLGLYQEVFGTSNAEFHRLAIRAVTGLGGAFGISLALYALTYARYSRRIPEMAELGNLYQRRRQWDLFAARALPYFGLPTEFERACFCFAVKTLLRSQRHRLLLAGFSGLGVAIAIQDVTSNWPTDAETVTRLPGAVLLSAPLAIAFFTLSGLRFAFNVPSELRANWTFRILPEQCGNQGHRVAKILMLIVLAPTLIVTLVVFTRMYGVQVGSAHTVFVLIASAVLTDGLLLGYRKIPFTCSYATAKHHAGIVVVIYFLFFLFFSSSLAVLERSALSCATVVPFFALVGVATAIWAVLLRYENRIARHQAPLMFEDEPDAIVPSMDLR